MSDFRPYRWSAEKVTVDGLRYRVSLADHILRDQRGEAEASMFGFSYTACADDSRRPVLFAYNGGPGAASNWLHMGLLGPKLADMPGYPAVELPMKFTLADNTASLLDICDIVLIDPVGTGWTRLFDQSSASKHYSTEGDARDFAGFICAWLADNGRPDAPVYLLGESYGTIRNMALADVLPENVNLRGIISVGTSLNVGAKTSLPVEPNIRRLGANAASCWYHHHKAQLPLEEFVAQAMDFAYGDYAHALLLGSRLPEKEHDNVLKRLSYFTGVSEAFLQAHKLRFGEVDFLLQLCPGSVVSAYDSRLLFRPDHGEKYSGNTFSAVKILEPDMKQDLFMSAVGPVFDEAFRTYADTELCPPEGRETAADILSIERQWDFCGYGKDTLSLPVELMSRRPALRMMFVNGYYDLMSTFDFMTYYLSQYDLPAGRTECVVMPAGHASYVGSGMAAELSQKIRGFIKK